MSQNLVLDLPGELPSEQNDRVTRSASIAVLRTAGPVPASTDVVRALSEALARPGNVLELRPGVPVKRPFDAQYWACWVVAAALPVLMGYLVVAS